MKFLFHFLIYFFLISIILYFWVGKEILLSFYKEIMHALFAGTKDGDDRDFKYFLLLIVGSILSFALRPDKRTKTGHKYNAHPIIWYLSLSLTVLSLYYLND